MEREITEYVAAFEQTVRTTIGLAETFTAADWDLPTDCPGWTVKDVVSHIVSLEALLLGDPLPDHELPGVVVGADGRGKTGNHRLNRPSGCAWTGRPTFAWPPDAARPSR